MWGMAGDLQAALPPLAALPHAVMPSATDSILS